jgi:cell wall-associated NlpC family hydrolase
MAKKQDLTDLVLLSDKLKTNLKDSSDYAKKLSENLTAASKAGGNISNPGGGQGSTTAAPKKEDTTLKDGGGSAFAGLGGTALRGMGNFALSLPGVLAQALPSPAEAAAYQLSTARQGFFSRMGFGNMGALQKSISSGGTAISKTDAVGAISALQSQGIYNVGTYGKGVAGLSNYAPGLGLEGTATASASMNQAKSVNFMNQIGVQVRGADGLARNPNDVANELVDKIWQSTPPLQAGGNEAYMYLQGSLQPGNQLYLILNTYVPDANLRQIVITKLFAKAKGLPKNPSKQQLKNAGITTDVVNKTSNYNTAQLGLTQNTQADINAGTATALQHLTTATNKFSEVVGQMHGLLKAYGYTSTMLGGMNGAVGSLVGSFLGSVMGPVVGHLATGIMSKVSPALATTLTKVIGGFGAVATAAFAGISGYKGGKDKHWSWGNFASSIVGGAVSGAMIAGPWGALAGAVGGGVVYTGGYAAGGGFSKNPTDNKSQNGSGAGRSAAAQQISLQGASPQAGYALMTAASQIGVPYSWGGGGTNGPSVGINQGSDTVGFDCSGFVQYVFAKQGIPLGGTTFVQIKQGRGIPPLQAQPGDLLFFGTQGTPNHVGIYMGNGKMIESPHTGATVRIRGVNLGDVMACRRVLQDGKGSAINFGGFAGGGGGGATSTGISGAPGTILSSNAVGTTVGSGVTANAIGGDRGGSTGTGMSMSSSNGNIIINVSVPPTTSPNSAADTAKIVSGAVTKAMGAKSEANK